MAQDVKSGQWLKWAGWVAVAAAIAFVVYSFIPAGLVPR